MRLTNSLKVVLVGGVVATGLAIGGVAINAGATSTTYYACLASAGTLSHVGTTKPSTTVCKSPSKVISWDSQGPVGPQGPAGATGGQGSAGATGAQGPPGTSGYTNYDLAQQNGFEGSLPQWLASLVGPQGPTGASGPTGAAGPQGVTGPQGPVGPSGTAGIFGADNNGSTTGGSAGAQCNLGDVQLTASVPVATNWLPAKGQAITITSNSALFEVMGTDYGGNGTTNFDLPNLTAAAPDGLQYIICVAGVFP
jgi:Phage Tail Collar Domain